MPSPIQNPLLTNTVVQATGLQSKYQAAIDEHIVPTFTVASWKRPAIGKDGIGWFADTATTAQANLRGAIVLMGANQLGPDLRGDLRIEVHRFWSTATSQQLTRLTLVPPDELTADWSFENGLRPPSIDQPGTNTDWHRLPILLSGGQVAVADLPSDDLVRRIYASTTFAASINTNEGVLDPPVVLWSGRTRSPGLAMILEADNIVIRGGFSGRLYFNPR